MSGNIFAQKIDSKYLTALIYLKTDTSINQEIQKFKKHWLKKEVNNNDFNLSEYISYMPVPYLDEKLEDNDFEVNAQLHKEKYYFDTEQNIKFKGLIPFVKSNLYLLFSKPINNYLVAEFAINTTGNEIDMIENGPIIHLLFIFDENDLVKNLYVSYSYFN